MMWRFDEMKTTIFRLGVLAGAACLLGLSTLAQAATVQAGGNPDGAAAEIERINSIVRSESGAFSEEAYRVPAIKRDPQGRLWAAWQRWEGGRSRIELARFGSGGIETSLLVDGPEGDAVSPDFAFTPDGQPWIIWLDALPAETKVLVLDTASQQTWRLASEPTSSIAGPKIVCDGGGSLWAFWNVTTAEAGEVVWRTLRGGTWTAPAFVPRRSGGPAINPDAALDAFGTIWLAWSGYDGHDFEVYLTSWTGTGWAAETRLSQRAGPNLFPSVGQDPDGNPLVAWTRPSQSGRVVSLVSYRRGSAAPESSIATQAGPPSPPRILQGQNGPALCMKSGDALRIESLSSIQSLGSPSPLSVVSTPRLLGNLEFDEDKYVGFGDSITFGYENYYPFPERGYIPRLETILTAQYGAQKVINEGFGGEVTADGVVRIDKVFLADLARYILILDGTNDVIFDDITIDTADLNLREILRKCLAAGAFPAISTLLPRYDPTGLEPYFKNRLLTLNARIRKAAADLSVPLVDMYTAYINYPAAQGGVRSLLSTDLKHPSDKGYQVMAETWFAGIRDFPFPPVNLRIEKLGPSQARREPIKIVPAQTTRSAPPADPRLPIGNLLTWALCPKILDPAMIEGYRVYKKKTVGASVSYQFLGLVEKPLLEFFERGPAVLGRSPYVVSTVRLDGIEGPISDPIR